MAPKSLKEQFGTVDKSLMEDYNRLVEPQWSEPVTEEEEYDRDGYEPKPPKQPWDDDIKGFEAAKSYRQRGAELSQSKGAEHYEPGQKERDEMAYAAKLRKDASIKKKGNTEVAAKTAKEIEDYEKTNPKHALDAELAAIDAKKRAAELEKIMSHEHNWVKDPNGRANFHCAGCKETAGMDREGNVVQLGKSGTFNDFTARSVAGGVRGTGIRPSSGFKGGGKRDDECLPEWSSFLAGKYRINN